MPSEPSPHKQPQILEPRRRSRVLLWLGVGIAGFVVFLLLALGGFVVWLRNADLTQLAAREASEALGREVRIGQLQVRWANPLEIDVTDLRIANAPWGSRPDMVQVGRARALLDAGRLWRGVVHYERLRILDATIVLERDQDGTGNWKFPGMDDGSGDKGSGDKGGGDKGGGEAGGGEGGGGGFAIVPKDRSQFPTLIDFAGENGLITYRTRGGNLLRISLDKVEIAAPDATTPVKVAATGAYNGVAARVDATTGSFDALRDADRPFAMPFTLAGQETRIEFDGTAMRPLDFDGLKGRLSLRAETLNEILAAIESGQQIDLPLALTGDLARDEPRWSLANAKGEVAETPVTGDVALVEGAGRAPDDIALDLDFAPLDLDPILAAMGAAEGGGSGRDAGDWRKMALYPEGLRELLLSADLRTEELRFGATKLPDFALVGRAAGEETTLKSLRFGFGGGTLELSGALSGKDGFGAADLHARLAKADIASLAGMLGGGQEIRGRLDGAASLALRGKSVGDALGGSNGAAVLTLSQGDVARSLIEKVSTDLRTIFREKSGRVKIRCLLAAMNLRDGIGSLAPLRLETDAAVLRGIGSVDLKRQRLDLTLQTESDSTGFFALDLPIRVSGPFDNLAIDPQLGEGHGVPGHAGTLANLPAGLRDLAKGNACVK